MLRATLLACLLLALPVPAAQAAHSTNLSGGVLTITADDAGGWVSVAPQFGQTDLTVFTPGREPIAGCPPDESGRLVCPGVTAIRFIGGAGEDNFSMDAVDKPADISGGAGDDYLTGSWGSDVIRGGPGKDEIDATQRLSSGEYFTDGADTVDGGPDDDRITTRDGTLDTVDCGGGQDHIVGDLLIDPMTGCEEPEPQVAGDFTYTGEIAAGSTATMSAAQAVGTPTPTLTYAWEIYNPSLFATLVTTLGTGLSYTFTAEDIAKGTDFKARIQGCATATNIFGSHKRCATKYVPPAPVTDPPATGGPRGAGDTKPPVEPLKLATTALPGKLVPVKTLTVRTLAAFRPAGRIKLSKGKGAVPVLSLVSTGGLCQVTLTPTLALRGGKKIKLAKQRFRIAAGTSAVLAIRLTKTQRARLKRARRGQLRLAGTLRVGGVNTPLAASIPVS